MWDPFRADTKGSISMGRYGSSELSLTGTVRHSSTNRSFICCLCSPDCRLFKPTTNQPYYWFNIAITLYKPNIYKPWMNSLVTYIIETEIHYCKWCWKLCNQLTRCKLNQLKRIIRQQWAAVFFFTLCKKHDLRFEINKNALLRYLEQS